MKVKNVVLCLALFIVLFQSCIPSLHPLYTKDKLIMKKEISGIWIDKSSNDFDNLSFSSQGVPILKDSSKDIPEVWILEEGKNKSYKLVYFETNGVPAIFDAHLIQLGRGYFLNFYPRLATKEEIEKYPKLKEEKINNFKAFHYYPVNTFAKVTFEKDQMSIALFDGEFIEDLLDQNRIRIKHEKVDDHYILTAQPEELQKFIVKYANNEDAFPDPMVLTRP